MRLRAVSVQGKIVILFGVIALFLLVANSVWLYTVLDAQGIWAENGLKHVRLDWSMVDAIAARRSAALLVTGSTVFLLGMLPAVFLVAGSIAAPLRQGMAVTHRALAGESAARVPVQGDDENGQFAKSLNALLEHAARLRALNQGIVNAIPDPLFLCDENQTIQLGNRALAKMAGCTPEALVGRHCSEVMPTSGCGNGCCPVRGSMDTKGLSETVVQARRDGREVHLLHSASTVTDGAGGLFGYLGFALNVTALKDMEQDLTTKSDRIVSVSQELRVAAETMAETSTLVEQAARQGHAQRDGAVKTATAIELMNASAREVSGNTQQASALAEEVESLSGESVTLLREVALAIERLHERIHGFSGSLAEHAGQIEDAGRMLEAITGMADKISLLALKGAIEASRAGDARHGFTVVVQEVGDFAGKSISMAKEAGGLIASIGQGSARNVELSRGLAEDMVHLLELSNRSGNLMERIARLAGDQGTRIASIATGVQGQSEMGQQVRSAMERLNHASMETSQGLRQASQALAQLSGLTRRVAQLADGIAP